MVGLGFFYDSKGYIKSATKNDENKLAIISDRVYHALFEHTQLPFR